MCCYYQHANVRIIGLYFCYFITFYVILAVKVWIVFICRWVRCCVTSAMFELAQPPVTYAAWNSFKNARPYITHGVPIMYFRKSCPVRYLLIVNQIYNTHTRIPYYSTGVQIVSCTLSDDSVLSESTGLFNPVLLCQPIKSLLTKKNQPMRLCLSNQVRPGWEWLPSPLGDFNRPFEGLIGELFKIWHWNIFYFFKWHHSGP